MRLPIGCAAAFGGADTGSIKGVYEIHIHRHMKPSRAVGGDFDSLFYHRCHSALVEFAHSDDANLQLSEQFAFARVNTASANNYRIFRRDLWRKSGNMGQLGRAITEQCREWHPVNVARWR